MRCASSSCGGALPNVRSTSFQIAASFSSSSSRIWQKRAGSSLSDTSAFMRAVSALRLRLFTSSGISSDRTHRTTSSDDCDPSTHSTSRQEAESSHWLSSRTSVNGCGAAVAMMSPIRRMVASARCAPSRCRVLSFCGMSTASTSASRGSRARMAASFLTRS
ncbi:hypothetical protein D3C72_1904640 [compost metagenome]